MDSAFGCAGVFDGQVDVNGYLRLAWSYGKPPDSDCNETSENGRMTVMVVNPQGGSYNEVWVCFGIAGWQGLRF